MRYALVFARTRNTRNANSTDTEGLRMAILMHSSPAVPVAAEIAEQLPDAVPDALAAGLADALTTALPAAIAGYFSTLPTEDPEVVGAPWNDNGTVKISAGE